jgi:hypothetical protein
MAQNILGQTLVAAPGDGIVHMAAGTDTFDATAITATDYVEIQCGFTPRYVLWMNITDRVGGEWFDGMADNSCLKTVAAGTRTLEVTGGNGGITIVTGGFRVLQNATLALILASKVCRWQAQG